MFVLAGLAGSAAAGVRGDNPRERPVHAAARRESFHAREQPLLNAHQRALAHSIPERRPGNGRVLRETRLASGGGQMHVLSRSFAGGQVRVVRYGNGVSGSVERTIRPGFVSRTFVSGGHVLYTHVYQHHVWHHLGRAFAYETFVPAVRFPTLYYGWALAAWPRPVSYAWHWQWQPWFPVYGALFTPYSVYNSPDLWMTDYILAQSMQTAYQAQAVPPAAAPSPAWAPAAPAVSPSEPPSAATPSEVPPAAIPSEAPAAPPSSATPSASVAPPPAVTPQVKAQLDTQIKVQLQEQQQAAAATPAVLRSDGTPPALKPNHVFFEVVQPLDVPSAIADRYCTLGAADYIKRVGPMSKDDWMIPVVVELSRPSDCPEGLRTRIGLNDLNAMENEQEAQVMEAMQAASKSMGPNGPPSAPGVHPTLIADGSAAPDPGALDAIRQLQ